SSLAIESTLVQLSDSSVPLVSAVNPPKDGTTSSPRARMLAMALPNVPDETGMPASPFHTTVHDPTVVVCRKASVRNFAPDCSDRAAGSSPVQDSKYGAKTCAGRAAAAAPAELGAASTTARAA